MPQRGDVARRTLFGVLKIPGRRRTDTPPFKGTAAAQPEGTPCASGAAEGRAASKADPALLTGCARVGGRAPNTRAQRRPFKVPAAEYGVPHTPQATCAASFALPVPQSAQRPFVLGGGVSLMICCCFFVLPPFPCSCGTRVVSSACVCPPPPRLTPHQRAPQRALCPRRAKSRPLWTRFPRWPK